MVRYYRETNGDYLAVVTETNAYYRRVLGTDVFDCRATALGGVLSSVCTCPVSRQYLRENCVPVRKAEVPEAWHRAIGL